MMRQCQPIRWYDMVRWGSTSSISCGDWMRFHALLRTFFLCVALIATALFACSTATAQAYSDRFLQRYPGPPSRLVDLVDFLDGTDGERLEWELRRFECRHGAQMAVIIIESTNRQSIEEFSLKVATAWRLGRAGVNDGLLFTIARDDRRLRIELGTGLETVMSQNWLQKEVLSEASAHLRRDDRRGAISSVLARLSSRLPVLARENRQCEE